jgi:uncharacterized protein (UPF0335 family)
MSEDVLAGATISINGGPEVPMPSAGEFQRILEKKIRMKEGPEDREVKDKVFTAAGDELRSFCERYEHLEAEKRDIADQMKEVMAEAKGRGYDTKILRKLIALRKRDPDDVAEEQAVLDMYKDALGMS